jgi:phosphoribosyl 1,2-cyclic phosphodiesterase
VTAPLAGKAKSAETFTATFLGTRGETKVHSRRHRRHSSLLVERAHARIMIDCGTDWLGQLQRIAPTAVVLTHAHADHADGLAAGAPCPVYATRETWDLIHHFPITNGRRLPLGKSVTIQGVRVRAFPVEHSLRAPAVGFRVTVGGRCFVYVPDVARVPDVPAVLRGIDVYIGDGATIKRSMVRKRDGVLIGHAPVIDQLAWCQQADVPRAVFTHCGSQIVRDDAHALRDAIRRLGRKHEIDVRIASDGDRLHFRNIVFVSSHRE